MTARRLLPLLVALCAALTIPGAARAEVVWLCQPGMVDDPCEIPLDTTVREPGGGERVETPERAPQDRRRVDCFYVYPTVSNQPGPNADKSRDPELVSIAKYQAARFSTQCRVFAPIYRQATLAGITAPSTQDQGTTRRIAYGDVAEAWKAYLAGSGDRGFVLIGHSQGTRMLRSLLRREIDPDPALRRRLVGAVLLGGNVTVAKGRTTGGDFSRVPVCTQRGEFGCVVAFSSFPYDPPDNSRYGKQSAGDPALDLPGGPEYEVACTDPGKLSARTGPFGVTTPSEPFAEGPIALGIIQTSGGPPPSAPSTWVTPADRYQGECRTVNGANVLRYDPVGDSRRPNPFPEPSWGTHLIDVNLGLERQVSIVAQQAARWHEPDVRLTRRCVRGGKLRVRITGADAPLASRVAIGIGRRVVARRREHLIGRRRLLAANPRTLRAAVEMPLGRSSRLVLVRSLPRC